MMTRTNSSSCCPGVEAMVGPGWRPDLLETSVIRSITLSSRVPISTATVRAIALSESTTSTAVAMEDGIMIPVVAMATVPAVATTRVGLVASSTSSRQPWIEAGLKA